MCGPTLRRYSIALRICAHRIFPPGLVALFEGIKQFGVFPFRGEGRAIGGVRREVFKEVLNRHQVCSLGSSSQLRRISTVSS